MFLCLTDASGLSDFDGFSLGELRSTSPERSGASPAKNHVTGLSPILTAMSFGSSDVPALSLAAVFTETDVCPIPPTPLHAEFADYAMTTAGT